MRRRALQGLLNSFLGTYLSRHSDYDGYWVFGLIVENLDRLEVDLMSAAPLGGARSAEEGASLHARARFRELAGKHGLSGAWIRGATLVISRLGECREDDAGGLLRMGHDVAFRVSAVTDLGRSSCAEATGFVAIHDPLSELRRNPGNWGVTSCGIAGPGPARAPASQRPWWKLW